MKKEVIIEQMRQILSIALERHSCSTSGLFRSIVDFSRCALRVPGSPWGMGFAINHEIARALVQSAVFHRKPQLPNYKAMQCSEFNTTDMIFKLSEIFNGLPALETC